MSLALEGGRLADPGALARPPLQRALSLLNRDGEEARLVGGAVRDLLLGQKPGDFDLATTATPDIVMARASAAGLAFAPTGVAFGTVTLLIDGAAIETTTLREDIETDGRRAKVRFGRSFRADALRRDFTLNALSVDGEGRVHDEVGGLADLEAGRVRFIGEARQRIREDYLRILRFLRFSARFGAGALDAAGLQAAIAERAGLATLSAERVRAELLKILVARHAGPVVAEADGAGLFAPLGLGVWTPARLQFRIAREAETDALLRLAALGVRVREDAERFGERLRLSNAEAARLAAAADVAESLHGLDAPPSLGDLRILLFERGRRAAQDGLALAEIDAPPSAAAPPWAAAQRFLADTPIPRLPFTGADLLARGLTPGRGVGAALKTLQAAWIRAGFPKEPEILARLLAQALADA